MNLTILIGHVGQIQDIRKVGESEVVTFSLATQERGYTDKDGKKVEAPTEWHNIALWGKMTKLIDYISVGSKLCVRGSIRNNSYEKDGIKRYTYEIKADEIEFLSPKKEDETPVEQTAEEKPKKGRKKTNK